MKGRNLFEQHAGQRRPAFTWLGQHSFILTVGAEVVLVDPFLSDVPGRLVPPLFEPAAANELVSLVCVTHDHLDHLDPEAIMGLAMSTDCHFLAPRSLRGRMLEHGVDENRLLLLDDLESVDFRSLTITGVKAAHEDFQVDARGHHLFLGLVLESQGVTMYHAGDTVWWEGLQGRLRSFRLDAAFLPINGRDAVRFRNDVLGNMTYQEAADLAGSLDLGLVVPAHFGMFADNTEEPGKFTDYLDVKYPQLRYEVPVPGQYTPLEPG